MILREVGESIECNKCKLIAGKIIPSSPQIDAKLGRFIKYECLLNASVENEEELSPKKFIYKRSSNLDLATMLKAKEIYVMTSQLKRIKIKVEEGTGRHRIRTGVIKKYSFAEIKYPLEKVLNAIKNRQLLT